MSSGEHVPVPLESTGLCRRCRMDAALPNGSLCGPCATELDDSDDLDQARREASGTHHEALAERYGRRPRI
jgi:hypothetical protein